MDCPAALKVALDLIHFPSQAKNIKAAPLPDGVLILLQVAAGEEEATNHASRTAARPRETVREAAAFFIEQVLLYPNADSYRVLGANPQASSADLRRNVGLLLRWLHPDLDPTGERAVFAGRVTRAWNDLKTSDRRARYDSLRLVAGPLPKTYIKDERISAMGRERGSHNVSVSTQNLGRIRWSPVAPSAQRGPVYRFIMLLLARIAH